MNRQQLLQLISQLQQRSGVSPMAGQSLGQPVPPMHQLCGHIHPVGQPCPLPGLPCGSFLCCIN